VKNKAIEIIIRDAVWMIFSLIIAYIWYPQRENWTRNFGMSFFDIVFILFLVFVALDLFRFYYPNITSKNVTKSNFLILFQKIRKGFYKK